MYKCYLDNFETIHESFEEAFERMFNYVKPKVAAGQMSLQELETAMWIIEPGKLLKIMDFYTARDRACESGLLIDGKLTI
jgi:hypothetical protein